MTKIMPYGVSPMSVTVDNINNIDKLENEKYLVITREDGDVEAWCYGAYNDLIKASEAMKESDQRYIVENPLAGKTVREINNELADWIKAHDGFDMEKYIHNLKENIKGTENNIKFYEKTVADAHAKEQTDHIKAYARKYETLVRINTEYLEAQKEHLSVMEEITQARDNSNIKKSKNREQPER